MKLRYPIRNFKLRRQGTSNRHSLQNCMRASQFRLHNAFYSIVFHTECHSNSWFIEFFFVGIVPKQGDISQEKQGHDICMFNSLVHRINHCHSINSPLKDKLMTQIDTSSICDFSYHTFLFCLSILSYIPYEKFPSLLCYIIYCCQVIGNALVGFPTHS